MIELDHPVLQEVRRARPFFMESAEAAAESRELPDETAKRLRDIGVMRLLQPKRYGGFEADPRIFGQAVIDLARSCSATGWVTGVVGVHSYHLGLYDDAVQAEVWGDDNDTWISSSYAPSGVANEVDGGYELTGRWSFSSGSKHCAWVFVGANVIRKGAPPEYRHFLLPRSDYQILDVWNVSGLSGTGSNDIVVEQAFVPSRRTMSVADLRVLKCPGRSVNTGPLFSTPWAAIFLPAVVMPIIGMAQAVIDECVAYHQVRFAGPRTPQGQPNLPSPVTLARLAEAASEVDTARLQGLENLGDIYECAMKGQDPPVETRSKARRDQVQSVALAISACEKAYLSAGPRAIATHNRIQRVWRDAHAGQHHAVNLPDLALMNYGLYMITGENEDQLL